MPHDRRTARVLVAMIGFVGVAMSVGCLRSSNLRASPEAIPELTPAGDLHPAAGGTTSGTNAPAPPSPSPASTPARDSIEPPPTPALDSSPNTGETTAGSAQGMPAPRNAPAPVASPNPSATPAPGDTEAASESAPSGQSPASPTPSGDVPSPPAVLPTPLLDAEIRRAQSVTRQHFESLNAADTPTPVIDATTTPAAEPGPPPAADSKAGVADFVPPLPPLAASSQAQTKAEPTGTVVTFAIPPLTPIDTPTTGSAQRPPTSSPTNVPADRPRSGTDERPATAEAREFGGKTTTPRPETSGEMDEPSAVVDWTGAGLSPRAGATAEADREEHPDLEIATMRLCSKVTGFGSFEPVEPNALQPGRRVLVYWEMAGVEYQARRDVFVSRLAARFELRAGADGRVVWEHAPRTAEDVCPRRRHDYYASYPVELPANLEPGPYRLRLIQTDLISNRAASSEVPIMVVGRGP
jgi:hypothetical protein